MNNIRLDSALTPDRETSILDRQSHPVKLVIKQHQSPGDILMLSAALRDLHLSYPGRFITELKTP